MFNYSLASPYGFNCSQFMPYTFPNNFYNYGNNFGGSIFGNNFGFMNPYMPQNFGFFPPVNTTTSNSETKEESEKDYSYNYINYTEDSVEPDKEEDKGLSLGQCLLIATGITAVGATALIFGDKILPFAKKAFKGVGNFFKRCGTGVKNGAQTVWTKTKSAAGVVKNGAGNLWSKVKTVPGSLKKVFSNILKFKR